MNRLFRKILNHELLKGSIFVFAGSMIGNFSAYLFHIIVGRMLKPEEYAVIASLISFSYIVGFPTAMFNPVIVRKMASLAAKKDYKGVKSILYYLFSRIFIISLIVTVFFLIVKKPIADFLKIENSTLILMTGLGYAIGLFVTVNMATLQGLLKFGTYSIVQVISSILRVAITFLVIILGFGVFGVTVGLLIVGILTCIISFKPLAFILSYKSSKVQVSIKTYFSTVWVSFSLIGMSLMITTDLLLVKHFFPSFDAGLYAALSTIGRVVLFATSAIAVVLLPLSTKKKESGHSSTTVFKMSQLLSFIGSISIILVYLIYPKIVINFFYGEKYYAIAPYLGLIGVYFLIYNAVNLFVNFHISLKKKTILTFPLICAVVQTALITLFHNSFYQILYVMIFSILLLLIIFCLHYFKYEEQN